MQYVEKLGKARCSDHRRVTSRIRLGVRRGKLLRKKPINELIIIQKIMFISN